MIHDLALSVIIMMMIMIIIIIVIIITVYISYVTKLPIQNSVLSK